MSESGHSSALQSAASGIRFALIGVSGVFLLASAASAQGCGAGRFNGLSIGVDAGLARYSADTTFTRPTQTFPTSRNVVASEEAYGSSVGGRVGYDLQCQAWVFGIEADHSFSRSSFGKLDYDPFKTTGFRDNQFFQSSEIDGLSTIRGRLGYALTPSWLVYGTAGLAIAQVKHGINWTYQGVGANNTTVVGTSEKKQGLAIGAGTEYSLGTWTIRAEALHIDLNDSSVAFRIPGVFGAAATTQSGTWDQSVWMTRVGLTYRFNPW